jgi:hypothetical protein
LRRVRYHGRSHIIGPFGTKLQSQTSRRCQENAIALACGDERGDHDRRLPAEARQNERRSLDARPAAHAAAAGEGLVTDRAPTIVRGRDGTIIEVSEWQSQAGIDAAHTNPNVLASCGEMFAVCDCVPPKTVPEAEEMFAGFEPLEE